MGDIVKGQVDRPLSFREGEFHVEGVPVKLFKVLFDAGALHISPTLAPTMLRSIGIRGNRVSSHIKRQELRLRRLFVVCYYSCRMMGKSSIKEK